MAKTTLVQSLEKHAHEKEDHIYKNLWHRQITRLISQGFTVKKVFPTGLKGQYYCFIGWKDATVGAALRLWEIVCNLK